MFKECAACHAVEAGKNKIGPSLFGVVGAKAGHVDGFRYSAPLKEKAAAGLVWTEETLITFVNAPKELIPAGSMAYAGLAKSKKHGDDPGAAADLVAYLATLK